MKLRCEDRCMTLATTTRYTEACSSSANPPHRLEFLQPACVANVTWLQRRAPSRLGAITRQNSSVQSCELAVSQPSTNLTGTSRTVASFSSRQVHDAHPQPVRGRRARICERGRRLSARRQCATLQNRHHAIRLRSTDQPRSGYRVLVGGDKGAKP